MSDLQVSFGLAARDVLVNAFNNAKQSIDAELYKIEDTKIIDALNAAAARGVTVHLQVEGDPDRFQHPHSRQTTRDHERCASRTAAFLHAKFLPEVSIDVKLDPQLLHAKAAVVDDSFALVSTGNVRHTAFTEPGEIVVRDDHPDDVHAIADGMRLATPQKASCVVAGPNPALRAGIDEMLASKNDLRIAAEGLSDQAVIAQLKARQSSGHHDRIMVNRKGGVSPFETRQIRGLERAGVDVRCLPGSYMHEKYVDDGDAIYIGSANLTYNGLEEAREVGVIAAAPEFGSNANLLRADFERDWSRAIAF